MCAVPLLAAPGVPVIWPAALIDSPPGSPLALNVYAGFPPAAATVALYAAPATPFGSDAVVMVSPALMVMDRFAVAVRCVGLVESVTVICAVPLLAALGVPVIAPAALIDNPLGRPVALNV